MSPYNPNQYDSIFNEWAKVYDKTVSSSAGEYSEVFAGYDRILEKVTDMIGWPAGSLVLDLGTGTGNLAARASKKGYQVIGLDPNRAMIKIARAKYPETVFKTGDFLNLPALPQQCAALISSYAFHHLTDEEKARAARLYHQVLAERGKVIFADTVFLNDQARSGITREAEIKGYAELVKDLNREYYTTHVKMRAIFENAGFETSFAQMNKFVWIIRAEKK